MIVAFVSGGIQPGVGSLSLIDAKTSACNKLISQGCSVEPQNILISDFDADKDGQLDSASGTDGCGNKASPASDNLYMLCKCYYGANITQCKQNVCGC